MIIKYIFTEFQVGPALLIKTIRLQKYISLSLCPQSTLKSEKLKFEYLKIKKLIIKLIYMKLLENNDMLICIIKARHTIGV